MRRRLAAVVALVAGAATIALALADAVSEFPRGLVVLACLLVAGAAAWYGVLRRGLARVAGLGRRTGARRRGGMVVVGGARFVDLLVLAGLLVSLAAARAALPVHVDLPRATAPKQPVLFFNPRSGGGKAERFKLADEARSAGSSRSSSARPGTSRRSSAAPSIAAPTGSRWPAATARRRSSRRSPPSGGCPTRASRPARATTSRSISASTATTSSARSTRSSTAVSGPSTSPRSTGVCSSTTSRSGSTPRRSSAGVPRREDPHDARHRARRLGPGGSEKLDLRWTGPGGQTHHSGAMVLVSNNRYRLGRAIGSGTRPRIDDGLLGHDGRRRALPGAARAAGRRSARCASGRRRRSRSTRTGPSRPASTARR